MGWVLSFPCVAQSYPTPLLSLLADAVVWPAPSSCGRTEAAVTAGLVLTLGPNPRYDISIIRACQSGPTPGHRF